MEADVTSTVTQLEHVQIEVRFCDHSVFNEKINEFIYKQR